MKQKPSSRQDVPTINLRELILMHVALALVMALMIYIDWHVD